MTIERRYQRAACLTVLLSITAYATAAGSPLLALVACPLVIGLWRYSAAPAARLPAFLLPRWAVNTLLAVTILFAVYRTLTRGPTVETVAEMVVLLQLIKLGDRRTARDDAQLLALAVFLAIAAMLTSNTLWVGLQLIAFLPVLVGAVMLHQIHAGLERTRRAASAAGREHEPAAAGRRFAPQLRAVVALAMTCAIVTALIVFVLMPRGIGENQFGRWGRPSARQVTGFSDRIQLGSGGVISESQEVVMDVQIRSTTGDNLGSDGAIHYLRGAVLDDWDGKVWASTRTPRTDRAVEPESVHTFDDNFRVGLVEQVVRFRTIDRSGQPIFAIWRPVRLKFVTRGRVAIANHTRTGRLLPERDSAENFEYRVISALEPVENAPEGRSPVRGTVSDRIRTLAAAVVSEVGLNPDPVTRPVNEDALIAERLEDWLRGNFRYTLTEPRAPEDVDPVEHFLFQTREGHCEYFASAMTLLCRAVGVNARMAVGYVAAEYNAAASAYTVRQSNAHAWVEAELGRGRWRRFDPTPAADLQRLHRPELGVAGRFRQWIDALEFLWNSRVVSFDERARTRVIGRSADGGGGGVLGSLDRFVQRVRFGGPRLVRDAALGAIAVFVAVAVVGGLAVLIIRSSRFARSPRRRRPGPPPDPALAARLHQVRFYDDLLELLEKRGHAKPAWSPPLDHAARLQLHDAPLAGAAAALSALYYRVRFGARAVTDAERTDAEALLARVAADSNVQGA